MGINANKNEEEILRKTIMFLATFAVLGLPGATFAQQAVQIGQDPAAEDVGQNIELTCADLNEMEPAEANAFLRGYEFALKAETRSSDTSATTTTIDATSTTPQVGVAAGTGDPSSLGGEANSAMAVGAQAIMDSCFDAPATSLNEALSGVFGKPTDAQ